MVDEAPTSSGLTDRCSFLSSPTFVQYGISLFVYSLNVMMAPSLPAKTCLPVLVAPVTAAFTMISLTLLHFGSAYRRVLIEVQHAVCLPSWLSTLLPVNDKFIFASAVAPVAPVAPSFTIMFDVTSRLDQAYRRHSYRNLTLTV